MKNLWLLAAVLLTHTGRAQSDETKLVRRTTTTTTTTPDAYNDRDAIRDVLKKRLAFTQENNQTRLEALFTTDAQLVVDGTVQPNVAAVLTAISARWGKLNAQNQQLRKLRIEERYAFVTETYDVPAGGTAGGGVVSQVLKKGDDGRWRISQLHLSHNRR